MLNTVPELYTAILGRRWMEAVEILCDDNNHNQCQYINESNNQNALHLACYGPAVLVEAIVAVYPEAALGQNDDGETPLHVALTRGRKKADDVALAILEACPQAATVQDNRGWSSLRIAIEYEKSTNVIRALLLADPCMIMTPDDVGQIPLETFFQHWNMRLRSTIPFNCNVSRWTLSSLPIYDLRGEAREVGEVYEQTCLVLKAAIEGNVHDEKDLPFFPVHASLKIPSCPWSFFNLLIKFNPQHHRVFDSQENLPIHIVSSSPKSSDNELYSCHKCRLSISKLWYYNEHEEIDYCVECYAKGGSEEDNHMSFLDEDFILVQAVDKVSSIIESLLELTPESTSTLCGKNRFPLAHSVQRHNFCTDPYVDSLFYATPEALSTRDIGTHMTPFMVSATERIGSDKAERRDMEHVRVVCGEREKLKQFTAVFGLLMEDPTLVHFGALNQNHRRIFSQPPY